MSGPQPPPGELDPAGDLPREARAVHWLLNRYAQHGHTCVPVAVLEPLLRGHRVDPARRAIETAVRAGIALVVEDDLVALPALAAAEEQIATVLRPRLASPDRLRVVVAGAEIDEHQRWAAAHTGTSGDGHELLEVEDADTLDVQDLADLLADMPDDAPVALIGDVAALAPSGAGAPFLDLASCPDVTPLVAPLPDTAMGRLLAAVRAGRLPVLDPGDHTVVVSPTPDEGIAARLSGLMATSIPRAFAIPAEETLVVTVRRGGSLGAEALADAFTGSRVVTAAQARGARAEAAVLVLPGEASGSVHRALLVSAMSTAVRHLSVVTGMGPSLPEAVRRDPPGRWTRLPALLRGAAG